jgi:hypothetical protein
VDEVMVVMNMGSYMSYALRFGFLNALYFLGGACLCLEGLCYKYTCAYDGSPLFSKTQTNVPEKLPEENQLEGGMYATNASATSQDIENTAANKVVEKNTPAKNTSLKVEDETQVYDETDSAYDMADFDVPPDMDVPPDEAMTGGNVYFDAGYAPRKTQNMQTQNVEKQSAQSSISTAEVAPAPVAPPAPTQHSGTTPLSAPRSVKQAVRGDAKATFGSFLRSLRKIAKSGVLLTLCMDLDSEYEDSCFVLYTTSDTIYRSLQKPEHAESIEKAFFEIGIQAGGYELRMKGKQSDGFNQNVAELKETFGGVKIDIK